MNKKEKLIAGILKKELKGIKKTLKDQEQQISDIKKNGFSKEIHKGNRDSIWTGLHYTQGYCTAHIWMTEKFLSLLSLKSHKEVENLIKENKAIEKSNKAEMKKVFDKAIKLINDKKKKSKK